MKKFIRDIKNKETGAISALVLFTILMFIVILMGTFFAITTMQKSQLKSDMRIQEIYGADVNNIDQIYIEKVAVCKIGETYYETLIEAIDALSSSNTPTQINIIKDFTETDTITIAEGKNVEIVLNGKTMTGMIQNYGNLVLKGEGTITRTGTVIENRGILEIAGATITTHNSGAHTIIQGDGTITLTSGIISNAAEELQSTTHRAGALEINKGNATLSGGTIYSICGRAVGNHGTIELCGTDITSNSSETTSYNVYATVCNFSANDTYSAGVFNMTSGTIKNTGGGYAVVNGAGSSNFTKTGGTIEGTTYGI